MSLEGWKCAGCGCPLAAYEVFASRVRGLKRPVCLGCAIMAVVFLRDEVEPMLAEAIKLIHEAHGPPDDWPGENLE